MLPLLVKSAIVLAAAGVAALALRRASAALRHAVWAAAFCSLTLLPALEWMLPVWTPSGAAAFRLDALSGASRPPVAPAPAPWIPVFEALWAAGATFLLARLVLAWDRASRLAAEAAPGGTFEGLPVLVTGAAGVAFTWGVRRPAIVLPGESREWTHDHLEAVLAHERAHAVRWDNLWNLAIRIVCAVYWPLPLVWLAARRAFLECERACDDRVLGRGAVPSRYASWLVGMARAAAPAPVAALPAITRSSLEQRVHAILAPGCSRRELTIAAALAVALLAAAVTAPLAAMQSAERKVYKIGKDVKAPVLLHKVEPKYSKEAHDAKLQGTVVLGVVIGVDGVPAEITVKQPLGLGLDEQAAVAVKQWRFRPGTRRGKPVRVAATIEVNFKLL